MVENVTVYLDNDQLAFDDAVRCGFIVSEDHKGEETFHNDLVDSCGYFSIKELVDEVANTLKVKRARVLVAC